MSLNLAQKAWAWLVTDVQLQYWWENIKQSVLQLVLKNNVEYIILLKYEFFVNSCSDDVRNHLFF